MKKYLYLIILGLVIRIFLSGITYHSDIQHFDLAGKVITSGKLFSFYDYISPQTNQYVFNYPPMVYISLASLDGLLTSFEDPSFHNDFLFNYPKVLGDFRLNLHLILLKVLYLIPDFGILLFLFKIFENPKERDLAVKLWIFNPINLYATYMIGQFDIIAVFFVVLSIYLTLKKNPSFFLAAISLGVGASFKIFPVFLAIPLASLAPRVREKVKLSLTPFLIYFLTLIPFLSSKGFRASALIANQSLKSLYAQIPISGGESIILFPTFLIFFYLLFFRLRPLREDIWKIFFSTLLLFFILTHYHPQWFLWLTPFFMFDLIKYGKKNILALSLSLVSFVVLLFFFDSGLTLGLFSPIDSQLINLGSFTQIGSRHLDINFLRSIFQTIFAGSALYLIYFCLKDEKVSSTVQ